jgi:hypothetical protein
VAVALVVRPRSLPSFSALSVLPASVVRATLIGVCLVWPAVMSLQLSHSTAELPSALPWFDFPELPAPAPAVEQPVAAPEPAPIAAPPTVPARLRPWTDYSIPPPTVVPGLPLRAEVARWQPLVLREMATLRASRPLHTALNPELVLAVIDVESGGDALALSSADAVGLMQILPSTFATVIREGDPFDPTLNVRAGVLLLDQLLRRHDGDIRWTLAAYNSGVTASIRQRAGEAAVPAETVAFVGRVMRVLGNPGAPPLR